ncbi:hypothetical protein QBC47DRAFT_190068 [Echria macrotheca]|uniref:Heterokaryon incompatibility domain-containing protein n=1 Tax=Echria macrotheca TaxID=438768 RepID=A0AAJ0FBT1_9PEZI|nr:hypothetical protein QBC47DRAFT_190068 [Echria macrotheca]
MRLLHAETFKLKSFAGDATPPYAILSHTWGEDHEEWTLERIQAWEKTGAQNGKLWSALPNKILGCCRRARKDKLSYVWIDSCCIDKKDSVELGEAINSMFNWYQKAARCYAYLSDVPNGDIPPHPSSRFRLSRWFGRGWTLQELIAPKRVEFYNASWAYLGTKSELSLVIENITGIPRHFLKGAVPLHRASVAQRMSWAAGRVTKRREDIAYCLLGLFGVHIPMIYGEGDQAFQRLQREIMTQLHDDSILAWGLGCEDAGLDHADNLGRAAMAASPNDFADSRQIVPRQKDKAPLRPMDLFGGSLRLQACIITQPTGDMFALLHCGPTDDATQVVAIPLIHAHGGASEADEEYIRPRGRKAVLLPQSIATDPMSRAVTKDIFIRKDGQPMGSMTGPTGTQLYVEESDSADIYLHDVHPAGLWDEDAGIIEIDVPTDEEIKRIVTRFRSKRAGEKDLIIVLEVEKVPSPQLKCHLLTVDPAALSLVEISKNFVLLRTRALQSQSAKIGGRWLKANFTQSPAEHNMLFLCIDECPASGTSIDIAEEMAEMKLLQNLVQINSKHHRLTNVQSKFSGQISTHAGQLRTATRDVRLVSQEIRNLEDRLTRLQAEHQSLTLSLDFHRNRINAAKRKNHHICEVLDRVLDEIGIIGDTLVEHHPQSLGADQTLEDVFYSLMDKLEDRISANADVFGLGVRMETFQRAAAYYGDLDLLRLFVWGGFKSPFGQLLPGTLHFAVRGNEATIVQFLLQNQQIDADEKDDAGRTPLSLAASYGNEAICQTLLNAPGVNPNAVDDMLRSPLWYAAESGRVGVVKLLTKCGADVALGDSMGSNPLHVASQQGHEEIVRILIAAGATGTEMDSRGRTPMSLASERGLPTIVALLSSARFGSLPCDHGGGSPLSDAFDEVNPAMIEEFQDAGPDGNKADSAEAKEEERRLEDEVERIEKEARRLSEYKAWREERERIVQYARERTERTLAVMLQHSET